MHGPEAATPHVTRYSATASEEAKKAKEALQALLEAKKECG